MDSLNKILILVIGLLVAALAISVRKIISDKNLKSEIKNEIQKNTPKVSRFVDAHGSEHAVIEDKAIDRQTADIVYADLLDSIAKLNKLKNSKQIIAYDEYKIRKESVFAGKIDTTCDSVKRFSFSGNNFTGKGEIDSSGKITGSISLNLRLSRLNYWERKWFLGNRRFYQNLWSADTTIHIDSIKHLRIEEAEMSRWAVSCFAGYDVLNMRPAAGIALSYDIFRFKKHKKHKK